MSKVIVKKSKFKEYMLPITAGIVTLVAVTVFITVRTGGSENVNESSILTSEKTDTITISKETIQISSDSLSDRIKFIDYESDGTAMQIMLLKTSDGIVRSAFNTCQQCNGSPYAFFVQSGDNIICQNCGNSFALEQIGVSANGCNPIPVEYSEEDGEITVDTSLLDKYAPAFVNWKKGI